jgi:uncharacterized protein (TIGR02391 family)
MPQRYVYPQVVTALNPSFRSIDWRIVIARLEEEPWHNAFCVIRLRPEPVETVRVEMAQLEERCGRIQTEHFRIHLAALPMESWDEFISSFETPLLTVGLMDVELRNVMKPAELGTCVRDSSGFVRSPWGKFPAFEFQCSGGSGLSAFQNEVIGQEVATLGYSTFEAVAALCDVGMESSYSNERAIFLHVPVLAMVTKADLDEPEKRLEFAVRFHSALAGISALALVKRREETKEVTSHRVPLKLGIVEEGESFSVAGYAGILPIDEQTLKVDLKMSVGGLGQVVERDIRCNVPPHVPVNWDISQRFKPPTDAPDYTLHPEIERMCGPLFRDGHFREAALKACIRVIEEVKNVSGLDQDGDDLMNRAFSLNKKGPVLRTNELDTAVEKDEHQGFFFLFRGFVGLRNALAHSTQDIRDATRAYEYLSLASLLMRVLETAENSDSQVE